MKKEDLIKKADLAQERGDIESMKYYDRLIEIENNSRWEEFKRMIEKGNRIWIVPNNDLEAKTIIEMLQREGEEFLVTGQAWGASWEKLEEELKKKITEEKQNGQKVYGVELQGNSDGAINVDHHTYGEDDRSNPKSSIEQVAEILGIELTLDEQFVSANDKGYIPAMEKLGEELGINPEDLREIIANIRMRDREMQGVTPEQEAQTQEAVEKLGEIAEKREYIQLDLPHSKTSTVTDRLYGKYDNLLITSGDGETNFYGTTEIINMLNEKFPGGWSGGQLDQGSGFWGGYADQEAIKQFVQAEISKEKGDIAKVKEFWQKKYNGDKIGTISKLSQAMQHNSWLREWQRVHGEEPRIKDITKKVDGVKVKVGEANIAVPWSQLPEFFREANEYGDNETVKFLKERIERGDVSELSKRELYDLSEKENVKWSDGKHSLNPFQGYLYEFVKDENYILDLINDGEDTYGHYYPLDMYTGIIDLRERIDEELINEGYKGKEFRIFREREYLKHKNNIFWSKDTDKADVAFARYYTTRLLQKVLKGKVDLDKYKFVKDITLAKTHEEIDQLDEQIIEILKMPETKKELSKINGEKWGIPGRGGNIKFEKNFYDELREEVAVEIKKDSDRIENAYKVYVALEKGDLDKILEDPETAKLAKELYDEELKRNGNDERPE